MDAPHPRLFGRDRLLKQLTEAIRRGDGRVLLRGPSGVGKSALTRALVSEPKSDGRDPLVLRYEIASEADALEAVVGDLAAQLIDRWNVGATDASAIGGAIVTALREHPLSFARGALIDALGLIAPRTKALTEGAVEAIVSQIEQDLPRTGAARLVDSRQDEPLAAFSILIDSAASQGWPGTVILDRLDAGADRFVDLFVALSERLPRGWTLIGAVNDETVEGLEVLPRLERHVAYVGGVIVPVSPLTFDDVEAWANLSRPDPASTTEVAAALHASEGRPLFLLDWIGGGALEGGSDELHHRLHRQYRDRLRKLSREAAKLVRTLAILPSSTRVPLEVCAALAQSESLADAELVIDELVSAQFVLRDDSDGSVQFLHEITRDETRRTISPSAAREIAGQILALSSFDAGALGLPAAYVTYALAAESGDQDAVLQAAPEAGAVLVREGAYRSAQLVYENQLGAARAGGNSALERTAAVRLANVLIDTGYYAEALAVAQASPLEGAELVELGEIDLTIGRVYLRLNQYTWSEQLLDSARSRFAEAGHTAGEFEVEKERNVILRDLGEYEQAVTQADQMLRRAEEVGQPTPIVRSWLRAIARGMALSGRGEEGLEYARSALDSSVREDDVRGAGNAHLAIAECLRHLGQIDEASHHYAEASELALVTANRDSYLWSSLGQADCRLLAGLDEQARTLVEHVVDLAGTDGDRHPLEGLYARFVLAVLAFRANGHDDGALILAADRLASLGSRWPSVYAEGIISGGENRPMEF